MSTRKYFGRPTWSEITSQYMRHYSIGRQAAREMLDLIVQEADEIGVDATLVALDRLDEARRAAQAQKGEVPA